MRRKLAALLCAAACLLALTSCGKNEPDGYALFCRDKLFADGLPDEELAKPTRVLGGLEDFTYALDYMAFYRVGDTVYFEFDPAYAQTFFSPYTEFQKAYQAADLADVYACRLEDTYYTEYGVVGIKYSMSRDVASAAPAYVPDTRFVPSFDDDTAKGDAAYEIPLEMSDKPAIHCENGEQLYYLAMNGYRPVPKDGSAAATLYARAREIVHGRIRPDMSEFQKIKAIYDCLTAEIYYDKETAYSAETYLVREQAYYLEGVFLNRCAVCDGRAKAYALLLNMLDIPCVRTTGASGEGDHAWNYVCLDGRWYTSCTTYGQTDMTDSLDRILPNYAMLLAGRETPYGADGWGYTPQKHLDIYAALSEEPYDVYAAMGADDGVGLTVRDVSELAALLEDIASRRAPEYKVEFVYDGPDAAAFQADMVEYLSELPGVNAVEIKSERGTVYQVIYLDEK